MEIIKPLKFTKDEAKILGIKSGKEKARKILKKNKLSDLDKFLVKNFYSGFENNKKGGDIDF